MDSSRREAWQSLLLVTVACILITEQKRFGSPRPDILGVGLLVFLLAMWQAARGRASLFFFRSVRKSDAPSAFWFAVFFTSLLGIACMLLSYL